MLWLMVARQLARGYRNKEQAVSLNHPPRLLRRPRKRALPVGQPFDFSLPLDTFIDPDQGDVLARLHDEGDTAQNRVLWEVAKDDVAQLDRGAEIDRHFFVHVDDLRSVASALKLPRQYRMRVGWHAVGR